MSDVYYIEIIMPDNTIYLLLRKYRAMQRIFPKQPPPALFHQLLGPRECLNKLVLLLLNEHNHGLLTNKLRITKFSTSPRGLLITTTIKLVTISNLSNLQAAPAACK